MMTGWAIVKKGSEDQGWMGDDSTDTRPVLDSVLFLRRRDATEMLLRMDNPYLWFVKMVEVVG